MIVTGTLPAAAAASRPAGTALWAAVDVEWTKNYRVRGGNRPFCFSVVYLAVPDSGPMTLDTSDEAMPVFHHHSVYVEDDTETEAMLGMANDAVRIAFTHADRVVGHQFTSDLGVLRNTSAAALPAIAAARERWLGRRRDELSERQVIDTRYDTDHLLGCASRRLVDVCGELGLDVTQPELRGTSMTALHRQWLTTGTVQARERVSVLNPRHSLSTALVAMRAIGAADWRHCNVNRIVAAGLTGTFDWLEHRSFTALLHPRATPDAG